jgi:hypothetical protein
VTDCVSVEKTGSISVEKNNVDKKQASEKSGCLFLSQKSRGNSAAFKAH